MSLPSQVLALDLDGTLIDARRRHTALASHLCNTLLRRELDVRRFWALKREGRSTNSALHACGFSIEDAHEVAQAWVGRVEEPEWLRLDEWLPGARSALMRARADGLLLRIVTARQDPDALHSQLIALKVTSRVDQIVVVSPSTASASKVEHIAGSVAFIGDSETDAMAAKSAGIEFLAVTSGVRSGAFLRAHGATRICTSVNSALKSLKH